MCTLWIARHGNRQDFVDPDWAARAERPHDPGLSPDGVAQAQQLGNRLADERASIDRVIASPFLRTIQTAHHVAEQTDHPIHLEPGLSEWRNPHWYSEAPTLLPPKVIQETFARVRFDHDVCGEATYPETREAALERIAIAGRCLANRYADESLLLVGHGITVWGLLRGFLGDVEDTGCPLASLTQLVYDDGQWHLRRRNDVSHLEEGAKGAGQFA